MAGMRYQKIVDRLRVLADKVRHHYSDGIKAQQAAAKHALETSFTLMEAQDWLKQLSKRRRYAFVNARPMLPGV